MSTSAEFPPPTLGDHPERPDGARGPDAPFPWWLGVVGLLCALAVTALASIIVIGLARAAGVDVPVDADSYPPGVTIAITFLQDFAFLAVPFVLAVTVTGKLSRGTFGLRRPPSLGAAAGIIAGTYVGFLVLTAIWTQLLDITQQQQTLDELGTQDSTASLIAVAVLVCVAAPIAEETLFRGLIFTSLRRINVVVAVVVTGLIFGLVHYDGSSASLGYVFPLGCLGAALCVIYYKTGSLLPCILLHALNNSIAFGSGVGWSWQIAPFVVAVLAVQLLLMRWVLGLRPGTGGRLLAARRS